MPLIVADAERERKAMQEEKQLKRLPSSERRERARSKEKEAAKESREAKECKEARGEREEEGGASAHSPCKLKRCSKILLQFGRRAGDSFALDFAHPFSPVQAFAVALSALHSKLGVD